MSFQTFKVLIHFLSMHCISDSSWRMCSNKASRKKTKKEKVKDIENRNPTKEVYKGIVEMTVKEDPSISCVPRAIYRPG